MKIETKARHIIHICKMTKFSFNTMKNNADWLSYFGSSPAQLLIKPCRDFSKHALNS